MRAERKNTFLLYAAAAASGLAVFVVDVETPVGVGVWVFYMTPVAITIFGASTLAPVIAAAVSSVLVIVGYLTSEGSVLSDPTIARFNRTFVITTVWIVAMMVRSAVGRRLDVARQSWIRMIHGRLTERLQGEQSVERIGDITLRTLAEALEAAVGSAWVLTPDRGLVRCGGFALPREADAVPLRPGESLVGQALLEERMLRVRDVPRGYLPITSGVGRVNPAELLIVPTRIEGKVNGVIEVGLLRSAGEVDIELLDFVSGPVGVAIASAQYRAQLQELLSQTQRQSESLRLQGDALRLANEELEQQAEELRVSQASLETQQQQLERTNAELEIQASELERQRDELRRSQSEIAEKAAEVERASRYKSEFLANMSHELRTPLNSTLILAKLLADNPQGNLTDEQVKYARTITAAGNDLLTLINDVLDLSKIEAGRLDMRIEAFPLARLLEELSQRFGPLARQRGLAFDRVVEAGAPEILQTDAQRLGQVLNNLLSNAFKFTEQGGVTLRVSPASDGRVAFEVADTGIGIPPDRHAVIFEPFRQADGSTTRKYGGTGLGLSIARDLAKLLGGELRVESRPGRGSTFSLAIPPRIEAPAPASAEPARAPPAFALQPAVQNVARAAPRSTPGDGARPKAATNGPAPRAAASAPMPHAESVDASKRVLIVEDDRAFAEILCGVGRELGFGCRIEDTADGGFRAATEEPPVAILLDVGLPDHSGLSLLDRLKANPDTRHIPVHVISASDDPQPALEMGAVGYAVKPISRDALVDVYRRLEQRLADRLRRVLVIEDDEIERESIGKLLAGEQVEIVGVGTAEDAYQRLRSEAFDCVVMDLTLPDASGYDLLDRLDADGRQLPPVVVYTGRSLTADEEHRLRRRSPSIIVKGARSPERLLDEVTLFLHRVEADLTPERRRMLARSREAAFEDRKILLVEDDARNVFALATVLEPRGAKIEIARNGREALEALERDPAMDLVLMDIMMPEMDGYEAMRRIRAQPRFAKLPIVAVTARAMHDDQERALRAGANDYIAKPIDVDKLLSLVRVWLPR